MKKEKTVQLLEQLNCKMDKIIKLLEDNHPSNVNVSIKSIRKNLGKFFLNLNKEEVINENWAKKTTNRFIGTMGTV